MLLDVRPLRGLVPLDPEPLTSAQRTERGDASLAAGWEGAIEAIAWQIVSVLATVVLAAKVGLAASHLARIAHMQLAEEGMLDKVFITWSRSTKLLAVARIVVLLAQDVSTAHHILFAQYGRRLDRRPRGVEPQLGHSDERRLRRWRCRRALGTEHLLLSCWDRRAGSFRRLLHCEVGRILC